MFTQANRAIAITTPLGPDKLLLESFQASEAISRPFRFELTMLAQPDTVVDFDKLLGQAVTARLDCDADVKRYFNGVVIQLAEAGQVKSSEKGDVFQRHWALVVPKWELLRHQVRSRIFQQLTVVDILKKVMTGFEVSWETQGTFEPRDYCVQYRESDFDFASRLMEEEGIFYFFKHADGSHKMVVTNSSQSHPTLAPESVEYTDFVGLRDRRSHEDRIVEWSKTQELRAGKTTLWDHTFEMPDKNQEATKPVLESVAVGTVTHKLKVGGNDQFELYDFPGGYAGRFDGIAPGGAEQAAKLSKISPDGTRTVEIRMQEETTSALRIQGAGNVRPFSAGAKFDLAEHYNGNGSYILIEVQHSASLEGTYTTGETVNLMYRNEFACIPAALPYRPLRATAKPKVFGTQTAVVVGGAGQEIFTDKYGRVKVQFFWDREGKKDANSSCWIRVAQPWGGKQWGGFFLPRVGHEVLVDFLEGDPDQPIIVGSVYNAENMPPYVLPDNMTRSTIKSRSTLKGAEENFNEIRFEDKKGSEEVYIHAEKDFNRVVENNDTLKVGFEKKDKGDQTIDIHNDRTITVTEGNQLLTVKQGNRTVNVDTGNDAHKVAKGHRTVDVDTGNDTQTVKTGNLAVNVDTGNETHTIKTGNHDLKVNTGAATTEAGQKIELKVGGNSIVIDQQGITISAMKISITAQGNLELSGTMAKLSGAAEVSIKGAIVLIN
ncbi:MAG: type VI secretion system tip protein TssI/VgrG [Planctomycetia bacterium]|nr:type VI secretion system tip protein TssI/VgrG [Planctomycetia bacterium]